MTEYEYDFDNMIDLIFCDDSICAFAQVMECSRGDLITAVIGVWAEAIMRDKYDGDISDFSDDDWDDLEEGLWRFLRSRSVRHCQVNSLRGFLESGKFLKDGKLQNWIVLKTKSGE